MKYSVIIPSYNSKDTILHTLKSLFEELKKVDFSVEVIVVDSSSDGTDKLIKENFPELNLIKLEKQTYQGRARNIGAKNSKGDYLIFIDSDCVLCDDYFKKVDEIVSKYGDEYAAFGGGILNGTSKSIVGTSMFILQFRDFLLNSEMEVKNFPATNSIYKKNEFLKMGGFPEDLGSSEETLFNLEFSKKYKILYSPSFCVYHLNRKNLKGFLLHQIKNGYNFFEFKKRYRYGSKISRNPIFLPLSPFIDLLSQ